MRFIFILRFTLKTLRIRKVWKLHQTSLREYLNSYRLTSKAILCTSSSKPFVTFLASFLPLPTFFLPGVKPLQPSTITHQDIHIQASKPLHRLVYASHTITHHSFLLCLNSYSSFKGSLECHLIQEIFLYVLGILIALSSVLLSGSDHPSIHTCYDTAFVYMQPALVCSTPQNQLICVLSPMSGPGRGIWKVLKYTLTGWT